MTTRLLIIGGVAGGATAAARARRLDETAEITVLERGPFVSYANCGLPYFIGGDIEQRSSLILQTPESFATRYRVRVLIDTEALEIDRAGQRVLARGPGGETWHPYDALILAQGGSPITPPIPGADATHAFTLWSVPDVDRLQDFITTQTPRTAVVVGGGFIGIEMAEAFTHRGIATTIVERLPSVMAVMDADFGALVAGELESNGVRVLTGVGVASVQASERTVTLGDGRSLPAELVLFAIGVRPELALAKRAGLEIGPSGGLVVDEQLRTTDPRIYGVGDMIEVVHKVSGRHVRTPLAGPANRQGRIAASNALGTEMRYAGSLGTSVVKVFAATAAATGLSERAAREAGLDIGVAMIHKDHHAGYYPGAEELALKLVYERSTARLLGAQVFGHAGADKRLDVLATALHAGLTLHDLAELDLAYAPPFSSANDPVNIAAFVGLNDLSGFSPLVSASELAAELTSATPPVVLDVRTMREFDRGHLRDARHLELDTLRDAMDSVPRDRRIVVYCRSGFRGHLAARVLMAHGHASVANVSGGVLSLAAAGAELIPTV